MRLFLLLLLAQWGRDIDPGIAQQMLTAVEDDLARIVAAAPADRSRLVAIFIGKHGAERIEAIKRFRNPELKDLFVALLGSDDWHVQHRALLALESCGDAAVIDQVWPLLSHPHRRLREKAAITLIQLWDERKPPADWERIVTKEEDFHVRQCLAALALRMEGKLPVVRVQQEKVLGGRGGLLLIPYDDKPVPRPMEELNGKGPAPTAARWTTPLLGWGEEEVADAPLEAFSPTHLGTDAGACLDGAGVYAAADGIVRGVSAGGIVLEHVTSRRETVQAVYLHVGGTVFVEPGERVACGQLLGTIGLGYGAENGGCFAHLEYRIGPPGPPPHAYDPARFLALWCDRTAPLLPTLRPLHASVRAAAREAEHEEYSKAAALATRARDAAEPGSEAHADAVYVLGLVAGVPMRGIERARRLRDAGYPGDASRDLDALAMRCRGGPGAEAIEKEQKAWDADALLAKALKGEARVDSAERREDADLLRRLLAEFGDTCLKPRIEELLK